MSKKCRKCLVNKDIEQFYLAKENADGRNSLCKRCFLDMNKQYKRSRRGREVIKKYNKSAKGSAIMRASREKYKNSAHGKAVNKSYDASARGQAVRKANSFVHNLKKLYGITVAEYDGFLIIQNYCCAICEEPFTKRPHIDHDHETNKVRGLLCHNCNVGLGHFRDNEARLNAAISYVKRAKESSVQARLYFNREGYFYGGKDSLLPKPIGNEKPWKGKKVFLEKLGRIQARAEAKHCKGWSTCRLCKKKNGTVTYIYADWEWPSGFGHYVREHNVRPSLAFQEFILGETLV